MITISLTQEKEQTIHVTLNKQVCIIRLVQRESCMFMDFTLNGTLIAAGLPCLYANKMIRYEYLGFSGDLVFLDLEGESDPSYDGLGKRFLLCYMTEAELVSE